MDNVQRAVRNLLEKMYVSDLQRISVESTGNRREDQELREYAKDAIRKNAAEFTAETGIVLNLDFLMREYWNE